MERPTRAMLRIGDWCVNPNSGEITRDGQTSRLEVRAMRLLVCLAERAGDVVSIDELLNQVWSGVTVSPDSVYQAVTSLRRQLGDDPKQPTYIATVPRLGYRMVAIVSPWEDPPAAEAVSTDSTAPAPPPARRRFSAGFLRAAGAGVVLLLVVGSVVAFLLHGKGANDKPPTAPTAVSQPPKSIAVLAFLDLTDDKMAHETFADGMTEELIDKFSKIPGLRVAAPTSSFFFKGKKISIADIAKRLDVAYVLDGSIRKSGARLRVAVRLIRADNGYVVWSETYDRPWADLLKVQDDIAGEVTKALRASIEAKPDHDKTP